MEGLMLNHVLSELEAKLPLHQSGWAFTDETTAALMLDGIGNLVLSYRPPQPVLFISKERIRGEAHNPFQRFLAARVRGNLVAVQQLKLDRVIMLSFAGESGFVDQPPVRLLFEVTGRNTNVLVLENGESFEGKIIMAAREITGSRNRFRTIRSGSLYSPPPPYIKIDPRTASELEIEALAPIVLGQWRNQIDGVGPLLSAELARRAGLSLSTAPNVEWPKAYSALKSLITDPTVSEGVLHTGAREAARIDKAESLRKALREPLSKRVSLLKNQLNDVYKAEQGIELADQDRQDADLLMAYAFNVPQGSNHIELPAFDGSGPKAIALEPQLTAIQNAEKRYTRARRREEVYERLAERKPVLQQEMTEAAAQVKQLETASLEELDLLSKKLQSERPVKSQYGMRFYTPSGFEILVGRNNKENATLTHRIGRSLDYWFHAQGYPGSHVIVRTGGKELNQADILYVARLAATHSKARGSSNVPVDYTRIKYVWRPKGAPAGGVHYTDQKTVFVDGVVPESTP